MKLKLPRIYPITDLEISGAESHTALIKLFLRENFKIVQIRDLRSSGRELYYDAENALRETSRRGAKLIVNNRADIAKAIRADGVHLGETDLPIREVRKFLGSRAVIGFSTHSLKEALSAYKSGVADYISIGPIFPTTTKLSERKPLGEDVIYEIKKRASIPVVAIGGITPANILSVWEAGAESAAVISALLRGDIKRNIRLFKEKEKEFCKLHDKKF